MGVHVQVLMRVREAFVLRQPFCDGVRRDPGTCAHAHARVRACVRVCVPARACVFRLSSIHLAIHIFPYLSAAA